MRLDEECKNHSDFILQANESMETLGNAILNLSFQYEKLNARSKSQLKELEITFENHAELVLQEVYECIQILSTYREELTNQSMKFKSFTEHSCENYKTKSLIYESMENIIKNQAMVRDDLWRLQEFVRTELSSLRVRLDQRDLELGLDDRKKEQDINETSQTIEILLKPFHVDFDALVKEIVICKKSIEHNEKKFEMIISKMSNPT